MAARIKVGGGDAGDAVKFKLTELVPGGSLKAPEYGRHFSEAASRKFFQKYAEYEEAVKLSNKGRTVQAALLTVTELVPKHIRACLSRTIFDGTVLEEDNLKEALARHAKCWEDEEIDPSIAAAGVRKALASRNEPTAMGRVEGQWGALEEFFAENASAERAFRDDDIFKPGPANIITKELLAGLTPPEFKSKVLNMLHMKGGWKEDPGLVYDTAREAAEAWKTVEAADRQRRQQPQLKQKSGSGTSGSKRQPHGGKTASTGSELASSGKSRKPGPSYAGCFACGDKGHFLRDCTQRSTAAAPTNTAGGESKAGDKQQQQQQLSQGHGQVPRGGGKNPAPSRAVLPADGGGAPSSGATLPPEPVFSSGGVQETKSADTIPNWTSEVVSSWRSLKPGEVSGFQSEGLHVDARERWCLADLSVPSAGAQGVCSVKAILDSGSGITTMSAGVAAKLQAMVPDVQVVRPMAGEHLVKLANGNVERVEQKTCLVRTALHTSWGPVVVDPCSFAVMPGTDDVVIMGSPLLEALGIDVYSSLGACARARNTSERGVATPELKDCRRVDVRVEALQQPGDKEAPVNSSVERLLPGDPATSVYLKQELDELDGTHAPEGAVQGAATGGETESGVSQLREPGRSGTNVFRRVLRGYSSGRAEPLKVIPKSAAGAAKARTRAYFPVQVAMLARCIATLVALGLVYCTLQAVQAKEASAPPENFCFQRPANSCTATARVRPLSMWCKTVGSPKVRNSDTAFSFNNRAVRALDNALMDRRFVVADSLGFHGECERNNVTVMVQVEGRDAHVLVGLVAVEQKAPKKDFRETCASCNCTNDERSAYSGGSAAPGSERDCSRRAAVSQEHRTTASKGLPVVLDVVSAGLGDAENKYS